MKPLSERQQRILTYIRDFQAARGYAPTIREIGKHCGISSISVVNYNLEQLEIRRLIDREPYAARSIRLTDGGNMPTPLISPRFVIPTEETFARLFYTGFVPVQEGIEKPVEAPACRCNYCGWVWPHASLPPAHLCPNDGQTQDFSRNGTFRVEK